MAARDVGFDAQASAQRIVTSLMSCTLDVPPAATAISGSLVICLDGPRAEGAGV